MQNTSQSQSAHPESFVNISARTDSYKYSFFPHTIHCWNLLPADVVESKTANQFKNALWRCITSGSVIVTSPRDSQHRPRGRRELWQMWVLSAWPFFSGWYLAANPNCDVKILMPERWKSDTLQTGGLLTHGPQLKRDPLTAHGKMLS